MKTIRHSKYVVLLLIVLNFCLSNNSYSQLSIGGIPEGIKNKLEPTEIIEVSVPLKKMFQPIETEKKGNHRKILAFAHSLDVDINLMSSGSWTQINNLKVWTLVIRSSGAKSLSLTFEDVKLKRGEKIFVYNPSGVLGAFTETYNNTGVFSTAHLKGDMLIVEFSSPYEDQGSFSIKKVAHAFLDIADKSGPCNININCPEGENWQTEKRSVIRIVIGNVACTGTLLNNSAQDGKALVLTANHCISSDFDGERSLFYFNYESTLCDTDAGASTGQVLAGAKVLSTNSDYDFSVIELNQHPPISFKPYYAGWNLQAGQNLNGVACIHHPWGDVRKISIEENKVVSATYSEPGQIFPKNGFWLIGHWEKGTTEDGSSGAALFDNEGLVIGSLVGGQANCAVPDSDYYQKINASFFAKPRFLTDTLSNVLDPLNSNIDKLQGYDPYEGFFGICDTLKNVYPFENVETLAYEYGTGYYFGHNSDSLKQFAEEFSTTSPSLLYGTFINVAKNGPNGRIILSVLDGGAAPDKVLHEKYIALSQLQSNTRQYIEFYPPVPVHGNFFISYSLSYDGSDTFAVKQAELRNTSSKNTAWVNVANRWISFKEYSSGKNSSSLDIEASLCIESDTQISPKPLSNKLLIYPNPVSKRAVIQIPGKYSRYTYSIYDISGKLVTEQTQSKETYNVIDLSSLSKGFYIIFVNASGRTYTGKIVKN